MRTTSIIAASTAAMSVLTGCQTMPATIPAGEIHHVVLIDLNDQADIQELHAANAELAHAIPGITWFLSGEPSTMGRGETDFDVGLTVTFTDEQAYRTYIDHPVHQQFIADWLPRIKSLRIIDITSQSR